jgi:hypothetical protein
MSTRYLCYSCQYNLQMIHLGILLLDGVLGYVFFFQLLNFYVAIANPNHLVQNSDTSLTVAKYPKNL